jgi:hypothetical protein
VTNDLTAIPPLVVSLDHLPEAVDLISAIDTLASFREKFDVAITNHEQAARASEYRARAADSRRKLEALRLRAGARARQILSAINAEASAPLGVADEILNAVDRRLFAWTDLLASQARAEREATEALARTQGIENPRVPEAVVAKTISGTHGASSGQRDNWTWELEDINLVPVEYLVPPVERVNSAVLTAKVRREKDKCAIPGIRVVNKPYITSRT